MRIRGKGEEGVRRGKMYRQFSISRPVESKNAPQELIRHEVILMCTLFEGISERLKSKCEQREPSAIYIQSHQSYSALEVEDVRLTVGSLERCSLGSYVIRRCRIGRR